MTGKYKVLIVTSRWSIDGKDMDGGCLTALNICEALSDASTIDVLLPRFYDGMSSDIVNKTIKILRENSVSEPMIKKSSSDGSLRFISSRVS